MRSCVGYLPAPLDAAATGGKTEAGKIPMIMCMVRLFAHSPLDANATGGKVEAVFFADPLLEVNFMRTVVVARLDL